MIRQDAASVGAVPHITTPEADSNTARAFRALLQARMSNLTAEGRSALLENYTGAVVRDYLAARQGAGPNF